MALRNVAVDADVVKALLKERGMSYRELALQTGVTFSMLAQHLTNRNNISPEHLGRIATVLKVPVETLMRNEDFDMRASLVKNLQRLDALIVAGESHPSEFIKAWVDTAPYFLTRADRQQINPVDSEQRERALQKLQSALQLKSLEDFLDYIHDMVQQHPHIVSAQARRRVRGSREIKERLAQKQTEAQNEHE